MYFKNKFQNKFLGIDIDQINLDTTSSYNIIFTITCHGLVIVTIG
jgi:hypothetical protein